MGNVFFEAMRWGLPIISAHRGGPEAIFGGGGAQLIDVTTPDRFASDIAGAIRAFATDAERLADYAQRSSRRYAELGDWNDKAARATALYQQVLDDRIG